MSARPRETALLAPVLRLFPKRRYRRYAEVPLGRKRLDLLCLPRTDEERSTAVELKVDDWRTALWQASIDLQIAHRAYVALWHEYAHRAERNADLLRRYGVGLISVGPKSARIVIESAGRPRRIPRARKPEFYRTLLFQV